jgi:hypothetical protein
VFLEKAFRLTNRRGVVSRWIFTAFALDDDDLVVEFGFPEFQSEAFDLGNFGVVSPWRVRTFLVNHTTIA